MALYADRAENLHSDSTQTWLVLEVNSEAGGGGGGGAAKIVYVIFFLTEVL